MSSGWHARAALLRIGAQGRLSLEDKGGGQRVVIIRQDGRLAAGNSKHRLPIWRPPTPCQRHVPRLCVQRKSLSRQSNNNNHRQLKSACESVATIMRWSRQTGVSCRLV